MSIRFEKQWLAGAEALVMALLACSGAAHRNEPVRAAAPQAQAVNREPESAAERERLLATGKRLFVERCASCHDERGDKPLASGPPLNERPLARKTIEKAVNGRFRNKTDEEKRAVLLYIESFRKK
jgi:mono/diheme cytochrome c family protein